MVGGRKGASERGGKRGDGDGRGSVWIGVGGRERGKEGKGLGWGEVGVEGVREGLLCSREGQRLKERGDGLEVD